MRLVWGGGKVGPAHPLPHCGSFYRAFVSVTPTAGVLNSASLSQACLWSGLWEQERQVVPTIRGQGGVRGLEVRVPDAAHRGRTCAVISPDTAAKGQIRLDSKASKKSILLPLTSPRASTSSLLKRMWPDPQSGLSFTYRVNFQMKADFSGRKQGNSPRIFGNSGDSFFLAFVGI